MSTNRIMPVIVKQINKLRMYSMSDNVDNYGDDKDNVGKQKGPDSKKLH
jgi:hypothetical protein